MPTYTLTIPRRATVSAVAAIPLNVPAGSWRSVTLNTDINIGGNVGNGVYFEFTSSDGYLLADWRGDHIV